jgi:hypothetical protein
MKVSGILKNKARVLDKVIYLDVVESANDEPNAPKKQWILFKDKHTLQDIKTIINAEPGYSLIVDGKDNINKMTGQQQIVVNSLLDVIPPNATMPTSSIVTDDLGKQEQIEKDLAFLMRQLSKQDAITMLAKTIVSLNGSY